VEGREAFVAADLAASMARRRRDDSPLMRVLEWSLWLYTALLFVGSGPTSTERGVHRLRSTDGLAAAIQTTPVAHAHVAMARAVRGWNGVRVSAGSALPAPRVPPHGPAPFTAMPTGFVTAPDIARISLGFLADHSLAPPHLG
jgi:hypothetical protein